jgi:hypothetical protein
MLSAWIAAALRSARHCDRFLDEQASDAGVPLQPAISLDGYEIDLLGRSRPAGVCRPTGQFDGTHKIAACAAAIGRVQGTQVQPVRPDQCLGIRRASTSISIFIRGSARPHAIIVAAGRTSPK